MDDYVSADSSSVTAVQPTEPIKHIRKALYRQRAHCNPLSDAYISYPRTVDYVDWSVHYPRMFGHTDRDALLPINSTNTLFAATDNPNDYAHLKDPAVNGSAGRQPDFLDCGCGFGALTYALAEEYPDKLVLGMEIREKVSTFVAEKIKQLRAQSDHTKYENCSVVRTNAMKFLPNYIRKNSLEKFFFCFPDPHFKRTNWRRRIVTPQLLSSYAYHMKDGGHLYFVTDVEDLFKWMCRSAEAHPLFTRLSDEEASQDFAYMKMQNVTDEGKKAIRGGCTIYAAMYVCVKRS